MIDVDNLLRVIDMTASDHYTTESECELCGSHLYCSCNEKYVGYDHVAQKIKEAVKKWLESDMTS